MKKYKIAFISTEDYAHRRIFEEIHILGHELAVIHPQDLSVEISEDGKKLLNKGIELDADIILHKMSTDFRDGLVCLEAVKEKYYIFNSAEAVLRSANKFLTAAAFQENHIPIYSVLVA
jgi:glutathione synthase/RimK-type ligase-like ATP-grasp enzyme